MVQIRINAQGLVWITKRVASGRLVAWCDLLGLTVEGDSEADLHSMIAEAMHVLFLDLLEDGDLPAFLRDRGWSFNGAAPIGVPQDGVVFEVPYNTASETASPYAHP